jgi:hypothetical protein
MITLWIGFREEKPALQDNSCCQYHWVHGPCSSSGILNNSETGYGNWAFIRQQKEIPALLGPLERTVVEVSSFSKRPNRVGVSFPSPEDGKKLSSRNIVFFTYLVIYKSGRWTESRVTLRVIHHRQNPLDSCSFGQT